MKLVKFQVNDKKLEAKSAIFPTRGLSHSHTALQIGDHVVGDYLKYSRLLANGFCKIHHFILPESQKTPESIRRVN